MDNYSDFHTVKNLKFNVQKLQGALKQILKKFMENRSMNILRPYNLILS